MTDTFARMRQLIGSTAEWTANDIVLGYGELGIERMSATEYRAKVGDGSAKWSALPYLTGGDTGINAATLAALNAKLPIGGGTMTGDLILAHDAAKPNEAVTYTQLQNEVTRFNTALNAKLGTAGGSMTGPLFLSHDAQQPLEPVSFDQMTKAIQAVSIAAGGNGGLTFSGTIDPTIAYAAPVPAPANGNYYVVAQGGAVHSTWTAHLVNSGLTSVAVGDFLVWNDTNKKFVHVSNPVSFGAYVPLAGTTGTTGMTGNIGWAGATGSKKGTAILSGKGGTLDEIVIDDGNF